MLYGYALSFDIRNIPLAVEDNDRSSASREVISAFVNSGYFDVVAVVLDDAEIDRLLDTGSARAVLVIPARFGRDANTARPTSLQLIVNGDNANTATTVVAYGLGLISAVSARYELEARLASGPLLTVEPRVWYNPELRSTLFLVPGLIAYIAMLTAVVSTALSIVREKELGTMEQVRMSPLGPLAYVVGKTVPYFLVSLASAMAIVGAAMLLFDVPMRGSWVSLILSVSLFLVGRTRVRRPDLHACRDSAGRVSDRRADVVHADADAFRIHLPHFEHADGVAGGHLCGAGAVLSYGPARNRAQGRRL